MRFNSTMYNKIYHPQQETAPAAQVKAHVTKPEAAAEEPQTEDTQTEETAEGTPEGAAAETEDPSTQSGEAAEGSSGEPPENEGGETSGGVS